MEQQRIFGAAWDQVRVRRGVGHDQVPVVEIKGSDALGQGIVVVFTEKAVEDLVRQLEAMR
jgi:hypothetical protein